MMRNCSICGGGVGAMALSIALAMLSSTAARAQITTEALIGDAVSDLGARYVDIDEAIKRFNNHDMPGVQRLLEAAKSKNPALPPVELLIAKMYLMSGNISAGRGALEEAATKNPGDPEPCLILADQSISVGRMIEADALYDRAIQLVSRYDANAKRKRSLEIRCRTGRALVAERRENWKEAEDNLRALLDVDPDNATAHYRLGRAVFMQGKPRDGYNEFVKARELDRNLPQPYVATALMYAELDRANEAQQAFERALAADKTDIKTIVNYAQWLIKAGSVDKADAILTTARQSNPDDLDLLILSGATARMSNKMKPAEDYFIRALSQSPSNGTVINQLALLLAEQPDETKRQRALEFANVNVKLNPESPDTQITLAWVLYQLGRVQEATNALRTGMQLGNATPDSSYLVAKMLVERNQIDAAKQILTAALATKGGGIFVNRSNAQQLLESLGQK